MNKITRAGSSKPMFNTTGQSVKGHGTVIRHSIKSGQKDSGVCLSDRCRTHSSISLFNRS